MNSECLSWLTIKDSGAGSCCAHLNAFTFYIFIQGKPEMGWDSCFISCHRPGFDRCSYTPYKELNPVKQRGDQTATDLTLERWWTYTSHKVGCEGWIFLWRKVWVRMRPSVYTSAEAGPVSLGLVTVLALLLTCRGQCRGGYDTPFKLPHQHIHSIHSQVKNPTHVSQTTDLIKCYMDTEVTTWKKFLTTLPVRYAKLYRWNIWEKQQMWIYFS